MRRRAQRGERGNVEPSVETCRADLLECLRESDLRRARSLVLTALRQGIPPERLLLEAISPALEELGAGWDEHDVSLSQIYAAGRIAEEVTEILLTRLPTDEATAGTIVVGTIVGDHHGLGRRVVAAYLRSAGYRVVDLGLDVEPGAFVDAALAEGARVIGASALMANTALRIRGIDQELRRRGLRNRVKLLVGGAPFRFNPALVGAVGADAHADHAHQAVEVVRRLLQRGDNGR